MTAATPAANQGFIFLHRQFLDSRVFSSNPATFKVCIYLMLAANHKARFVRGIQIERGQCVRSLSMISDDCDLSRKAVRCALENLGKLEFISVDFPFGAHQGHRITVCKYGTYQDLKPDWGTAGANEGNNEGNNGGNTNNNVKNEKNEKNEIKQPPIVSDKPKRATWLTPYAEAWEEAFGGDMACGKESPALKAMEAKHGTEKTLAAWKKYLDVTESRFASAAGLQKGFGEYTGEKEINRDSRQRSGTSPKPFQHQGHHEDIKIKRLM